MPPIDAFKMLMERFVKNLGSWALTTKVYIILHRALKEPDLAEPMAKELKSKEHILYTFQKKVNDESFGKLWCALSLPSAIGAFVLDAMMHVMLSKYYVDYLKCLTGFMVKTKVLCVKLTNAPEIVKKASDKDIFMMYENFDKLVNFIFLVFEQKNFLQKQRLYQNMTVLYFNDLIRIYNTFYLIMTELLDRFAKLSLPDMKKGLKVYHNFLSLTDTVKREASALPMLFGFNYNPPNYWKADPKLKDVLTVCIEEKEQGGSSSKVNADFYNRGNEVNLNMEENVWDFEGSDSEEEKDAPDAQNFGIDPNADFLSELRSAEQQFGANEDILSKPTRKDAAGAGSDPFAGHAMGGPGGDDLDDLLSTFGTGQVPKERAKTMAIPS